ncbi:MAG: dephospho-CoA kinase [Bacteroidota bacterium]|jgi:dephospho-CoA kinase
MKSRKTSRRGSSLVVGVTGGIGSGKSEVCLVFQQLGAVVLSADAIAREIINTHLAVKREIRRVFGDHVYSRNGVLKREQVAALIFKDEALKNKLNDIVHPYVLQNLRQKIRSTRNKGIVVVEAALVYEARAEDLFDVVVVVDAPEGVRMQRISKRDGISHGEAQLRIQSQLPSEEKTARADLVIRNEGRLGLLRGNCAFIFHILNHLVPVSRL